MIDPEEYVRMAMGQIKDSEAALYAQLAIVSALVEQNRLLAEIIKAIDAHAQDTRT